MIKLTQLKAKVSKELNDVNKLIRKELTSHTEPTLTSIYEYLLEASGKQVRASLIIFIAKAGSYNKDNIIKLAAAIELIHLASLIHDDIIDEAEKRRNQFTIHTKFGLNNGILSGVHCYAIALNIISTLNNPELISIISKSVIELCEGESLQVNNRHNYNLSIDDYWKIVSLKTSSLFKVASQASALCSGLDSKSQKNFRNFGSLIGDIFQLSDDYLDLFDKNNSLNKAIDQDLHSGDISLPILLAIKNLEKPSVNQIKDEIIEKKSIIGEKILDEIESRNKKIHTILSDLEQDNDINLSDLSSITEIISNRANI